MKVSDLQIWLNTKIKQNNLNLKLLVVDGIGGPITRNAVYQVFKCTNAKAVTEAELLEFAKQLGDNNTKRIKAVGKVETNGSAWDKDGMPKILYERHYFYKFVKKTMYLPGYKDHFLAAPTWGGYTQDFNKNNINEKYIWFEYYGETALGKIFNKGDDENPNLWVIAIFSKTNAIQQIELEKIKKYLPLKLNTINSEKL